MRILCESHIPGSYVSALRNESWTTIEECPVRFSPGTNDADIAAYAEENQFVVFTRDAPFFGKIDADEYECGGLFLHMQHRYRPSAVVEAVADVAAAYLDHSEVAENLREWL